MRLAPLPFLALALAGCPPEDAALEDEGAALVCDADGDGVTGPWCGGTDCDDTDDQVSEGCGEDGDDDSAGGDAEVYTETVICEDWSTPVAFEYVVEPGAVAAISLWYEYSEVYQECWVDAGNASPPSYYYTGEVDIGEDGHLWRLDCSPGWMPTCFTPEAIDPVQTFASVTLVVLAP